MVLKYNEEDYKLLIAKSKYSILIVDVLFKSKSPINHQELCNALNIKKNFLSNIINKIDPFDILLVQRIGKNVYYSLTFKGVEFYNYINSSRQNIPEEITVGSLELAKAK